MLKDCTHIFKMWKWTPHRLSMLLMGDSIMTPKEKAKKAPIKKDDLVNEILKLEDGFTKKALNRINMVHLNLIKSLLTR